jgi:hypothetical protein
LTFLTLAAAAWTDLRWRIKNLETWRGEHMIDADSRDAIIKKMDRILYHLSRGVEGREYSDEWNGVERRQRPVRGSRG